MPGLGLDNTLKHIPAFHSYVAQLVDKRQKKLRLWICVCLGYDFLFLVRPKIKIKKKNHEVFATPE